jgi:hypothetical protein
VNLPLLPPRPFLFELLKVLMGANGLQNCTDDAYYEDCDHKNTSQKSDN